MDLFAESVTDIQYNEHVHRPRTDSDDITYMLNRGTVEASSGKQVFRTVSATIALALDKLIDDKDSEQLSEYFSDVSKVLKTVVHGRDAESLNESARAALEDLGRATNEIERTLRKGENMPRIRHSKDKAERRNLKIEEKLDTLNVPPIDSPGAATTSTSEDARGRLVRRAFALQEFPYLIEVIFSSQDEGDTIRRLLGDDAQAFVDVVYEALNRPDLSPRTRESCLKSLYRTCGRHALLPTTLRIPISYERTGEASYRGGFADVWKGEYRDQEVAVKVIRIYSNTDLQKVAGRFCKEVVAWKTLQHQNVLPLIGVTMSETRFIMISDWMANGNINSFVKAHPDANRLELLRGVASGLIYIHGQGMIHGDLKGPNILIDETGRARLADFGLLTIISDPKYLLSSSSHTQGGTVRWMSPERIAPARFGFKNSRPTVSSDCYALGMVIYETISGNFPFHKDADLAVFMKVVEGERPPRGAKFTKILWEMLEWCWVPKPNDRPSIEDVLQCLEMASNSLEPPSPGVDEGIDMDGDDWDWATDSSGDDSLEFFVTDDHVHLLSAEVDALAEVEKRERDRDREREDRKIRREKSSRDSHMRKKGKGKQKSSQVTPTSSSSSIPTRTSTATAEAYRRSDSVNPTSPTVSSHHSFQREDEDDRKGSINSRPTSEVSSTQTFNDLRAREAWERDRIWKDRSIHTVSSPVSNNDDLDRREDLYHHPPTHDSSRTYFVVQTPIQGQHPSGQQNGMAFPSASLPTTNGSHHRMPSPEQLRPAQYRFPPLPQSLRALDDPASREYWAKLAGVSAASR